MDEETSPVLPTRKGHSQGSSQVSQPRRSPSRWCVLLWAVCALQRCAVSLICSMHMELSGKCAGMWKPSCPVSPLVTVSVFTPVFLHLGISMGFSLFAGVRLTRNAFHVGFLCHERKSENSGCWLCMWPFTFTVHSSCSHSTCVLTILCVEFDELSLRQTCCLLLCLEAKLRLG